MPTRADLIRQYAARGAALRLDALDAERADLLAAFPELRPAAAPPPLTGAKRDWQRFKVAEARRMLDPTTAPRKRFTTPRATGPSVVLLDLLRTSPGLTLAELRAKVAADGRWRPGPSALSVALSSLKRRGLVRATPKRGTVSGKYYPTAKATKKARTKKAAAPDAAPKAAA